MFSSMQSPTNTSAPTRCFCASLTACCRTLPICVSPARHDTEVIIRSSVGGSDVHGLTLNSPKPR